MYRVYLKHEEYNGKTTENVGFIHETQYPDCKHAFKKAVSEDTAAQVVEGSVKKYGRKLCWGCVIKEFKKEKAAEVKEK